MNTFDHIAYHASHDAFIGRVLFWTALFCFVLAIVVIGAQREKLQSSGGGATSGTGTVVQPQVRPGHPSSTRPEKTMTECERLDGNSARACR